MALSREKILEVAGKALSTKRRRTASEAFVSEKSRKAMCMGAMKASKLGNVAGVKGRRARMSKKDESRQDQPKMQATHSKAFVMAVHEYARRSGDSIGAAKLLEATDPALTSTRVGLVGWDICEKISKTPSVSGNFVDFQIFDSNTLGFYFTKGEGVNEMTFERSLSENGEVTTVVKPGDKITANLVSDLYLLTVGIKEDRIKGTSVDETFEFDEDGDPIIEESTCLSESDADTIVKDAVFADVRIA